MPTHLPTSRGSGYGSDHSWINSVVYLCKQWDFMEWNIRSSITHYSIFKYTLKNTLSFILKVCLYKRWRIWHLRILKYTRSYTSNIQHRLYFAHSSNIRINIHYRITNFLHSVIPKLHGVRTSLMVVHLFLFSTGSTTSCSQPTYGITSKT